MAVAAILGAVQATQTATPFISNLFDNDKDPERFAKAQAWYQRAIQGDAVALCLLKYMSGRYGAAPGTGCGGEAAAGWATQAAKDYTGKLYDQALAVVNGQISAGTPISSPPGGTTQTISQVLTTAGAAATTAGYGLQGQASPQQKLAVATEIGKWVLIAGVAAVLGLIVYRSVSK